MDISCLYKGFFIIVGSACWIELRITSGGELFLYVTHLPHSNIKRSSMLTRCFNRSTSLCDSRNRSNVIVSSG